MKSAQLLLLGICLQFTFVRPQKHQIKVIDGNYTANYTIAVNSGIEYIIEYPEIKTKNPFRISTSCATSNITFPILITVKQEQQVLSWQNPMILSVLKNQTLSMSKVARTLCFDEDEYNKPSLQSSFTVYIWTASEIFHNVTLRTEEVIDYYIQKEKNYTVTVSPSEPVFYYYPSDRTEKRLASFIGVTSSDDICLVASVQNSACPVRDLNKDIEYQGRYQSVIRKGGLFIRENEFPDGFFLVFVAKGDNFDCMKNLITPDNLANPILFHSIDVNRTTTVSFSINVTIQEEQYVKPIMAVFGMYALFCLFIIITILISYNYGNVKYVWIADAEPELVPLVQVPDSTPEITRRFRRRTQELENLARAHIDKHYKVNELKLIHLVKDEEKSNKKSYNFLWHITNIGLFYGIPVVQLMSSYQQQVTMSGNEDICFHNFYCSRPYWGLTDFNHVYSNIGYVMCGLLFLLITLFRQKFIKQNKRRGIPKHYGMYFAMGFALILEGFMSGCYHICPSQMNFQFDTSFMYIMAVICIVKLYQNRHPDINASAYGTFTILGLVVFIAMLGILLQSKTLIAIFIISYMCLCFYISFKIYFFGEMLEGLVYYYTKWYHGTYNINNPVPFRKVRLIFISLANFFNLFGCLIGAILYPTMLDFGSFILVIFMDRFLILCIVNGFNFSFAIAGAFMYPTVLNFGSYLLAIFMGNLILHTIFYITMKVNNNEKICWEACLYIVMVVAFWSPASLFFFSASSRWELAPAESKMLNNDCMLLDFYDQHDIWHMLSAPALVFSFLLLMCLDDDIFNKPQNEINVF